MGRWRMNGNELVSLSNWPSSKHLLILLLVLLRIEHLVLSWSRCKMTLSWWRRSYHSKRHLSCVLPHHHLLGHLICFSLLLLHIRRSRDCGWRSINVLILLLLLLIEHLLHIKIVIWRSLWPRSILLLLLGWLLLTAWNKHHILLLLSNI